MAFSGPVNAEQLFRIADYDKDGVVGIQDALLFFSGAPAATVQVMNSIWAIAVTGRGTQALTRENFPLALALLSLAQQLRPVTVESLASTTTPLPPPIFFTVSPSDKAKYELLFDQSFDVKQGPKAPAVTGQKARDVLSIWPVSMNILGRIWELSDVDKDGFLSKIEFCIAMSLTTHAAQGKELPNVIPTPLLASFQIASPQQNTPISVSISPKSSPISTPTMSPQPQPLGMTSGLNTLNPASSSNLLSSSSRIAREALAVADVQQRIKEQELDLERIRTNVNLERSANEQAELGLKEEQAKGTAIASQIASLLTEIENIKAKTAATKSQTIQLRTQNADLVLDKRHREDELIQLKKQAEKEVQTVNELEEQFKKSTSEILRVENEAKQIEEKVIQLKREKEEIAQQLSSSVQSIADAALNLAKQRAALAEEEEECQQQQIAIKMSLQGQTHQWPRNMMFGPEYNIPEGSIDPKINPFETGEPIPNAFCYEPFNN